MLIEVASVAAPRSGCALLAVEVRTAIVKNTKTRAIPTNEAIRDMRCSYTQMCNLVTNQLTRGSHLIVQDRDGGVGISALISAVFTVTLRSCLETNRSFSFLLSSLGHECSVTVNSVD
jgi:hypothetical protein